MSKNKSFLLGVLAILFVFILAACSSNNANKDDNKPNDNGKASSNEASNGDESGLPTEENGMKFADRVELKIPVYDRAFEGWNVTDNYYTKWIQEEFGEKHNIDIKFVPIARANEETDYQQLLAAGNAPHIVFHYDMPKALNYYSSEVLQPLNYDEIKQYAPTYWDKLGQTIEDYGTVNDEKVFFFAERPDVDNFVTIIRKDWVEQVGMKVEDLTSQEKMDELAMKWKEAGLGTLGSSLTANHYQYSYPYRDWPIDPEYRALYSDLTVADFTTDETKEWLEHHSYQYHNGLIDQEFYLNDAAKSKSDFVAGRIGTYGEFISSNTDLFSATLANNPDADFAVVPPAPPEGKKPQARAYWPFGFIMGINEAATEEQRVAVWMYLEWMIQPDNLFFLQNGVEGENYTLTEDGVPLKNEEFNGESKLAMNNNKDYWSLVIEAPFFENEEKTLEVMKHFWSPKDYEYIVDDLLKYQEEVKEYKTPDALFTTVINSVNEYQADLNELFQQLYVDIVISAPDELDKKYEAAKKRYLEAGYQEILDEKQKAIDEGNYIYIER